MRILIDLQRRAFECGWCGSTFLFLVCAFGQLGIGDDGFKIPDTHYPIPKQAVFVAVNGNDASVGSKLAPLRTLGAAIRQSPPGGVIVLREGIYREGDHFFSKRLTIQPSPHEQVWLKGSRVLTAWKRDGAHWRHDNWTHEFKSDSYDRQSLDPQYPHAGKPDLVFVDGLPLQQVGSIDAVSAKSFFVDYATDRIFIGVNPVEKTIEAAANRQALVVLNPAADDTLIRGIGFMHYASNRFEGTLQCDKAKVTFENNTVVWGASRGITIYNSNGSKLCGNTLANHGLAGLVAWKTEGLVVEANRFVGNNQERFVTEGVAAEAAGAKITASRHVAFRNNLFEGNLASGLWFDLSVFDAKIINNRVFENLVYGIFYEISANAIIAGNVVTNNRDAGIALSNSSKIQVYNNTLADNSINLAIFDDSRVNENPAEIALGMTWIAGEIDVLNNVFSNSDGVSALLYARDFNSVPLKNAEAMIGDFNFNAYYRSSAAKPSVMVEWWRGTKYNGFADLKTFRAETSYEGDGLGVDDVRVNPFFVDARLGDYRISEKSIARGAGSPLPKVIAAELNLTRGAKNEEDWEVEEMDLGAFPRPADSGRPACASD
jgi:parallel beta-helix repeat protein